MMTWEQCAAAGMTKTEAARHRGVTLWSAVDYAKRHRLVFRDGRHDNGENLRGNPALHSDKVRSARAVHKMTPAERACYRALRQGPDKFSIDDALRLIGRADLIEGAP